MDLQNFKMVPLVCLLIFCTINIVQVNAVNNDNLEMYEENYYTNENHCTKATTCVPLINATCFGTQLPHAMTTLDLIPELEKTSHMITKRFEQLQVAQYLPKCWEALQPLLCALYKPKCLNGYYRKPGLTMCLKALEACEPIRYHQIWPKFIDCNNSTLFPQECEDPSTTIEFNKTSQCMKPLLLSESQTSLGIGGCGVPCRDQLYSSEEHEQFDTLVLYGASTCLVFNVFAMLTIFMNTPLKGHYYDVFMINFYFMIFCIGWLLQFTPLTSREGIACHKDGTRRIQESITSNLISSVVFMLIYYSSLSLMLAWLSFTECWYRATHPSAKRFNFLPNKIGMPIAGSLITVISNIDGSGITGIAFKEHYMPITTLTSETIHAYFVSFWSFYYIIRVNRRFSSLIKKHKKLNFKWKGRMNILFGVMLILLWYTLFYQILEIYNAELNEESFKKYIMCKIFNTIGETNECSMKKPIYVIGLKLKLLAPFAMGIVMSLLVFTKSALYSWVRIFCCKFREDSEKRRKFSLFIDLRELYTTVRRLEKEEKSKDPEKYEKLVTETK